MRPLLLLDTLASLLHLGLAVQLVRSVRAIAKVPPAPPPSPAPLVSVLVPARNEELNVERCVRSLLAQDYPDFEVVVLNDRSTDRTGAILARLADEDPRLVVLDGEPLPPGWVGKCWALAQAARHAHGEWLLMTDADTVHRPEMLGSVVRFAAERNLDLLSLGTGQRMESFWVRAFLPPILGLIVLGGGAAADVNQAGRPAAKANGQFLLFRASAYRAIGGHTAVRGELVEDFALARLVKRAGYRLLIADGRHLVTTWMYRSLGDMWQGFGKNAYREASRTPTLLLGAVLGIPLATILPPLLLLRGLRRTLGGGVPSSPAEKLLLAQSGVQTAGLLAFGALCARALGLSRRHGLAAPLAMLFFQAVLLSSAWRTLTGRGVTWKGRTYRDA